MIYHFLDFPGARVYCYPTMAGKTPLYRVIYEEILHKIETGEFKPGQKLPTEVELAEQYRVSRITSKKALDMAAEHHIITRRAGLGSFVTDNSKKMIGRKLHTTKRVFGIIQHDIADSFGLQLFQRLEQLAQEKNILTLTGFSNNDIDTEKKLIQDFFRYGVDGFIISPVHNETFNNDILKLILDGFPVVLIDRYLKDISCPNVISKNFEAACEGMNYLYSLGHRNIGILSRPLDSATTLLEREKGIMRAVIESGHTLRHEWWLTSLEQIDTKNEESFDNAKEQIRRFLSANRDLTAIFGLKYSVIPVVEVVAHELGLSIPEDLSLICFDSPGYLVNHIQPVTHLKQNESKMAERAFCLIEKMLSGEKVDYRQEIDVDLVVGETTCRNRNALSTPR